ncbi:MAG: ABC transporter ATP-binding protein [Actinobacteria bacterium]|jgi:ABC-2 type transport system ATP-binding protein|nr:ABC transporter ATP-binding protein [Actinomycetota bacterium]
MLEVRGISRSYGGHLVVNGISFTVEPGMILALLGPNGCGKSTTLKVLSGAIPPSAGEYTVDSHPGLSDEARRRTGYVPDTRGIFPRLTGREHLELSSRLHHAPAVDDVADELIERLELMEVIDLPAAAYSHGQSRRLSVAMALVSHPPLLLVDEPFDGVDPEGVETISELLVEARAAGCAVVLTTHLLDAAVIADQVAVFHHHELVGPFATAELLRRHGSLRQAWTHLARAVPT